MTKLTWGDDGTRFFEAGIDRGVLYIPGQPGVPWNGLKSVRENISGGEAQSYYLDGIKYANVIASEDFSATIEAFSSPREFSACDGTVSMAPGFYATLQRHKSFGMSYRTKIGDDISGLDSGYKIHLIYNALASTPSRENNTINNTGDPTNLSWEISTKPKIKTGIRPTAHFILDSRELSKFHITALEKVLYGSDSSSSYLPTLSEILTILETIDPAELSVVNNGNGSYSASGTAVEIVDFERFELDHRVVTNNGDGSFSINY